MAADLLVVGLGNPGPRYAGTRHNIGFDVVERLGQRWGASFSAKHQGLFADARIGIRKVCLLMPQTYMNLSGSSVARAMRFSGVEIDRVCVVHDEIDLPFGVVRLKQGGGTAGHNGLRSVVQHLGSDFSRVRIGIGRPEPGDRRPVADWVLTRFAAHEDPAPLVDRGVAAVELALEQGVSAAMNTVNAG